MREGDKVNVVSGPYQGKSGEVTIAYENRFLVQLDNYGQHFFFINELEKA